MKMTATGDKMTCDLSDLKARAAALSVNWTQLWADIQKYGPSLVATALTVAEQLLAKDFMGAFNTLISAGPAAITAIIAILGDLGINLPIPIPVTP